MKKTELVHFHNLLGTLATELHEEGAVSEEALSEYKELGTSPMAMRGSRAEHERAVLTLASALAAGVDPEADGTETDGTETDGTETDGTETEPRRTLAA